VARASADIRWWINEWVWTYDPRLVPSLGAAFIPMELYPIQDDFLVWLEEREATQTDGLVDKSRDMGATWVCLAFLTHRWLFREGFKGSIGSRKEVSVDHLGDPDSIFEKIRLLLRWMPGWMLPLGFTESRDDNYLKLINPANGSTLTGEAGDNIGRGGRSTMYFVDESAFLERPDRVDASLSGNTNVRIDVSTHNGPATNFHQRERSGAVSVFVLDWKQHPGKSAWEIRRREGDQEVLESGPGLSDPPAEIPEGCMLVYPWYEGEKARLRNPVIIAQEIDRDPNASVEGVLIPASWVRAAVELHKRLKLPKSDQVIAGLDVADGGACDNVLIARAGPIVEGVFGRHEGGTTDIANWARQTALEAGAKFLNYDSIGVGAGVAGAYKSQARTMALGLTAAGINVGTSPTENRWPDGRTSKEIFVNLRAELGWIVRTRFEKTWEFVEQHAEHPLDELISIPNVQRLIEDISSVTFHSRHDGKVRLGKKEKMPRSPDYYEALSLTFAPVRKAARLAVGGERTAVKQYVPR